MKGILFTRAYAHLYSWVKRAFGINLRGLGWALDWIQQARVIDVDGNRFFLSPQVSRAYGVMVAGFWNEPETHLFLDAILTKLEEPVFMVDVGASIGEFAVTYACHPKIKTVLAYEPSPLAADALRRSGEMEGLTRLVVCQKAMSDHAGQATFEDSRRSPMASSLHHKGKAARVSVAMITVECTTLDEDLAPWEETSIILMDIEGGEFNAIKGGLNYIERQKPLVIFEYNATSKQSFSLEMVRSLLGEHYNIFRLRSDGRLDHNEDETWNMVAVQKNGQFHAAARDLIV